MRRGSVGPGGRKPGKTGVDRTPPSRGHALAETPMASTVAGERRRKSKRDRRLRARLDRGRAARTQRPRLSGEAPTTGAAQRALALEPGGFLYAYAEVTRLGVVT